MVLHIFFLLIIQKLKNDSDSYLSPEKTFSMHVVIFNKSWKTMAIKLMVIKFFGTIIMLRFAKTKVAREKFYGAKQKKKKKRKKETWYVDFDSIFISNLVTTNNKN